MNKKNLALVMFMLIAVLALSAFRWTPSHLDLQRSLDADSARYTAMAEFYNAESASIQRGLDADAARYTAMAEFYNAEAASIQRGLDADAARYTGMAKHYMSEQNVAETSFQYSPPGR